MHVWLKDRGDFSTYTLCLVEVDEDGQPIYDEDAQGRKKYRPMQGIDPRHACVEFNFGPGCPSDLDCKPQQICPPPEYEQPEINYLSAADGGVFCGECGRDRAGATQISVNALKVLRFLQTREWETCHLLRLGPATHAEVERAMSSFITYHLERRLKSVDFLHRLRRQMKRGQVGEDGD